MPAAGARAAKAHPAVCKGTDLIEQLAKTDPAGYARIVSRASELENSQAIFWLIEKEGHEPSYLLGTVHLTDDRVKRLPVAAELAFAKAKHVAVETFFDSEEDIQHVLESMPAEAVSSTDEHLSAHLRVEEYARLTALAEAAGIDKSELDGLKPWVAEMLVRGPTCEARRVEAGELVLDAWLAGRALRRGLPLRKLETVAEQFETLAAIPYDQQLAMLRYALADKPSRAQDETETLIGLYLRRQIPATDALTRMLAPDGAVASAYLAAYWGDLIDRRNRRFVANAQPLLDQGRVFIAVGAAPGAGLLEGEPHGCATWFPCNDHPTDKARYRLAITVPRPLAAVAVGVEGVTTSDRRHGVAVRTFRWRMPEPTSTYMVGWYVDRLTVERSHLPSGVPVLSAYGPDAAAAMRREARLPEILRVLARRWGPYPAPTAGGIFVDGPIPYELETYGRPVLSTGTGLLTIVHENGHQWWGDHIALHRWKDICFNECLASYSEWIWREHRGTDLDRFYHRGVRRGGADLFAGRLFDMGAGHEFDAPVYVKGAFFVHALRNKIGDARFFRAMRTIQHRRGGGVLSMNGWRTALERLTGVDLTSFWHEWVLTTGRPSRANLFPGSLG